MTGVIELLIEFGVIGGLILLGWSKYTGKKVGTIIKDLFKQNE